MSQRTGWSQFKGLSKGHPPERKDIKPFEAFNLPLHPDTYYLVQDSSALEKSFGGNGGMRQGLISGD